MLGIIRDEGIDLDQFPPEYRQMMVGVSEYFDFYTQLLLNPPTLLNWACEFPPSTMLWSEGCACCDPHEQGLCQMGVEEFDEFAMQPINLRLRAECCYPVYQRRSRGFALFTDCVVCWSRSRPLPGFGKRDRHAHRHDADPWSRKQAHRDLVACSL